MADRPRFRLTAEKFAKASQGSTLEEVRAPTRVDVKLGTRVEGVLFVEDGPSAPGLLEAVSCSEPSGDVPGVVTYRVLELHVPGAKPLVTATPGTGAAVRAPSSSSLGTPGTGAAGRAPSSSSLGTPGTGAAGRAPSSSTLGTPGTGAAGRAPSSSTLGTPGTGAVVRAPTSSGMAVVDEKAALAARLAGNIAVASRPNLPDELRRGTEVCAEFTKLLVKLLNRSQYYGAQVKSRDEEAFGTAFGLLTDLIGTQVEFGFVVERSGEATELLVDGIGAERRKLSALLRPEAYENFVPKLVAYFEKYQVVTLAFRQGVPREEWETVVELLSGLQGTESAKNLSKELAARNVSHIATLTEADLMGKDLGIPWQIRICLTRLTRDLKTQPAHDAAGEERLRQQRRGLMLDVLRPFGGAQQLKTILIYCSAVQEQADHIRELQGAQLEEVVAELMRPHQILAAARTTFDDVKAQRFPPEPFGEERHKKVLTTLAFKLVAATVDEAFTLLREMYEHKLLSYDVLPPEMREWVDAEDVARVEAPAAEAPRFADEARWQRTLCKVARLLLRQDQLDKATAVLKRLMELGAADSPAFKEAMQEGLPVMVAKYCTGSRAQREALEAVFASEPQNVAPVAMEAMLAAGDAGPNGPAFHLLQQLGDSAAPAVRTALGKSGLKADMVRSLLTLAAKFLDRETATAVRPLLRHPEARIRSQVLTMYAGVMGAGARPALGEAVQDKDTNLVVQALGMLVARKESMAEADGVAAEIVRHADSPVNVLMAALRYAGVSPARDLRLAVGEMVDKETGGGLRRLLGGGGANRPDVLVAACASLAGAQDKVRLEKLAKHPEAAVKAAAAHALAAK